MSCITLFNTATYDPKYPPESITIKSMSMRSIEMPEQSIVFFYGFSEALKETSFVINNAYNLGLEIINSEIGIDIGEYSVKDQMTLSNVSNSRFLNLISISSELEHYIRICWEQIIEEKQAYKDGNYPLNYWEGRNYLRLDVRFLGELLKFEKFKHIEAISFFYEHEKIHTLCRRVAVFSFDHLVSFEKKTKTHIELKLPNLKSKDF